MEPLYLKHEKQESGIFSILVSASEITNKQNKQRFSLGSSNSMKQAVNLFSAQTPGKVHISVIVSLNLIFTYFHFKAC